MRSSTVAALFAGSVAAQNASNSVVTGSVAVVFNPLMPAPTMTSIGSSNGTVTYVSSCTGSGIPASWLTTESSGSAASSSAAGTLVMTPISAPSTTAAARLRRQDEGGLFGGFCEPITIKQGSTSVELHLEDPGKGVWTADMNCKWEGEMTTADLSCVATQSGSFAELNEIEGVTSDTIMASDAAEASLFSTINVVGPATNSAVPTASGSQSHSGNSTASGSGAPAATGAAAGAPLSKSVLTFVGGAAGVFAAALAL